MAESRTETRMLQAQLDGWEISPRKRRRSDEDSESARLARHRKQHEPLAMKHEHDRISSVAKHDPHLTAPFMMQHVPSSYAPQGKHDAVGKASSEANTKFCYRHRPDMLCRRQADEPTMDKLQKDLEKLPESDRQGIVQVWSLFSAAPSKQRNLMLQGILTQCCFPQLSFLSGNVQKLVKIDFLSALPPEISFRILSSLDTISLCKAAQVSRRWRTLADDDVVWHRMCEQHIDRKCVRCGWGLPVLDRKRLRASKRQMQLRAAGRGINAWSPAVTPATEVESNPIGLASSSQPNPVPSSSPKEIVRQHNVSANETESDRLTRPWKHVYRDRFRVGRNWKHGICSTKVLRGHTNGIMAMQILDNILATGSYDKTIKIWDLDTGKELRTLVGHTDGVRCLYIDDSKLISGGMDCEIRVWNWRTGECITALPGHRDYIIGLHFDSDILVSGSADKTAIVWDFKNKTSFTLTGHRNWVNSVRIDTESRTVFTASDDLTIKLWDLDSRECIRTFVGHAAHVQQVTLLPRDFDIDEEPLANADQMSDAGSTATAESSFAGHNQSPILFSRSLPCKRSKNDLYDSTFEDGRPQPPRYMVTSSLDSTVRLWDVHTGKQVRAYFGHVEGVWALAADSLRIVSGANDCSLKIWDPRTDKCDRTFTGHTGPVTCVGLSDSRMCSGSEDNEVRVYCFSDAPAKPSSV